MRRIWFRQQRDAAVPKARWLQLLVDGQVVAECNWFDKHCACCHRRWLMAFLDLDQWVETYARQLLVRFQTFAARAGLAFEVRVRDTDDETQNLLRSFGYRCWLASPGRFGDITLSFGKTAASCPHFGRDDHSEPEAA